MLSNDDIARLDGGTVYGTDGNKLGSLGQVYLDDTTGQPAWVTVHTGFFGTRQTFVPLNRARTTDEGLTVPYDKETVKGAPSIEPEQGHLSEQQTGDLYRYYSLDPAGHVGDRNDPNRYAAADQQRTNAARPGDPNRKQTSGDEAMTRAEERLNVGREQVETGTVRLRKYVVTENVTQTVPVRHEEVRVVREPITADGRTGTPADLVDAEQEVTLHAERPTVSKTVEAQERVRLQVDTVTEQAEVNDTIRKERIEVDGADDARG